MSAHQNQQQRLSDVADAFITLSSGSKMARREIFDGATRDPWHNRLLDRLCKEELLIKHDTANPVYITYEAVDGEWFASIAGDKIRLAEWYFKRSVIPDPPPAQEEEQVGDQQALVPPAPQPAEIRGSDTSVPQKILDTLILCAENIVYMRNRIEELHAKVDSLIGTPDELV